MIAFVKPLHQPHLKVQVYAYMASVGVESHMHKFSMCLRAHLPSKLM